MHAQRIDVHVLRFNAGVLCTDFFEYPLPQTMRVSHDV